MGDPNARHRRRGRHPHVWRRERLRGGCGARVLAPRARTHAGGGGGGGSGGGARGGGGGDAASAPSATAAGEGAPSDARVGGGVGGGGGLLSSPTAPPAPAVVVACLDLSGIGANLGSAGLLALANVAARGKLPQLRRLTLKDTGFKKAQIEALLRAVLDGRCPLEELELSGTSLCLSQPGRFSTDALRLVCALASREGTRLRKLGLRGTHLCGLAPGSDVGDRYILDGVALLCGALMSPHCAL